MKLNRDLFANELGSFVMGLKEAQDLFSEVGALSIGETAIGPILQLKDKAHGWKTFFWKGGIKKWSFCDKVVANHVAEELGFKPGYTIEVTAWLMGKESVMVKVFDTNTRPHGFIKSDAIVNALEMGFELGCEDGAFYLRYNGRESYLNEGDEIKGEYKRNFLYEYNPYHWKVEIKQIVLDKVICRCTHVADYRIG